MKIFAVRKFAKITLVMVFALTIVCVEKSLAGEKISLTIPPGVVSKEDRIASFNVTVLHAWVISFPTIPKAWSIFIKNDPTWKTVVSGGITVCTGAVYMDFFKEFMLLEKQGWGSVQVEAELITLDEEKRIVLKMKDLKLDVKE